jgi:myo-inositol-1(or 4)-monophosphatase
MRYAAIRGEGATVDGVPAGASRVTEIERAVVALAGTPTRVLRWRQYRALGSAALALCDLAAGRLDGYLDGKYAQHAPWDYLGALLVCEEAGAIVGDADGRPLVDLGFDVRRRIVAAASPELFEVLHAGMQP